MALARFWRDGLVRFGLIVAAPVVAVDQASKWVIVDVVMQPPRVIEVTGFFNVVMVWNRGVSFGLFSGGQEAMRWVLVALALAITVALVHWLRRIDRRFLALSIGLVIGGSIGNVIDRVRFGAVADFLDVHLFGYHWPSFNVADSAIPVGVAILLIDIVFGARGDAVVADRGGEP